MKIGYIRVSTDKQHLEMQRSYCQKKEVEKVFEEKISSTIKNRPQLIAMMETLRSGDVLYLYELSRLGRTARDTMELIEKISKIGVDIIAGDGKLDTTSPQGKAFIGMTCIWNQLERDMTQQRTRDALKTRRKFGGKTGGRKPMSKYKKNQALDLYDKNELSIKQLCIEVGVSHRTIYNWINERKANITEEN